MIDSVWDGATPADLKKTKRQRKAPEGGGADRLPPHSPECEMGILGCVMLSPKECMPQCIEQLPEPSVFYDLRNLTIYEAYLVMYDRGMALDVITVQQYLKDNDMLEQVGGIAYLAGLPDQVPSAANLSYYISFVKEKYFLRKLMKTCTEVVGRVYEYEGEVDSLMEEVSRDLIKITEDRVQVGLKPIKSLVQNSIERIEDYAKGGGALTGISTGYPDVDRLTRGLQNSEMIVIAARPSIGKTSLAMNISDNVAVEQRVPTGIFSLEMSAESLTMRLICSRARVNLRAVTGGFIAERDYPKITSAAAKISSSPLYIDDTASLTLLQLRAKARRMAQQFGVKLFVVDYLQLLTIGGRRENREQEVAGISKGIKALSKELNVPIIVLCQLNRDIEHDTKRKPRLSDLRESGAIEQDSDVVGLLYKPKVVAEEQPDYNTDAEAVNLLIAKQRNGPTGEIPLTFLRLYTRFESAAKVVEEGPEDQGWMFQR